MAGTDPLPAAQTNSLVSPQPCHLRAHRGKLFDELFALRLIPELLAATVWARTEFDLNILIDLLRLMPESARTSTLASPAVWAPRRVFVARGGKEQPGGGRHVGRLRAPFPTRRG